MTDKQNELLKAMHLIKQYCRDFNSCEHCFLAFHLNDDIGDCPFKEQPDIDWELHSLDTKEKINSVFK
jgi:hypothetical protein